MTYLLAFDLHLKAKIVYKSADYDQQQLSFFHFNSSCGMTLDTENKWILH